MLLPLSFRSRQRRFTSFYVVLVVVHAFVVLLQLRIYKRSDCGVSPAVNATAFENEENLVLKEWKERSQVLGEDENPAEIYPPNTLKLTGFKLCRVLEGALFHTNVHIDDLGGSLSRDNAKEAVELIENKAKDLRVKFKGQVERDHPMDDESVTRFICNMMAIARSEWASYASDIWLHHINAANYFPEVAFTPKPVAERKRYKIAYLIMVHRTTGSTRNLKRLVQALSGDDAVILIHVDARSWVVYERVKRYIAEQSPEVQKRLVLMERRHAIQWGMSSIVRMQLDGFFQLLDLADWDFVINLSANDYPLRSTAYIHSRLQRDRVYIQYWTDQETTETRVPTPHILDDNMESPLRLAPDRHFTWEHIFTPVKHHQWMVLPRGFVQYLRLDDVYSHNFLAWSEHGWVPDEFYFGMAALHKYSKYADKVVNANKRYIANFSDNMHPNWLTLADKQTIEQGIASDEYFFARKIRLYQEESLLSWMDSVRNEQKPKQKDVTDDNNDVNEKGGLNINMDKA